MLKRLLLPALFSVVAGASLLGATTSSHECGSGSHLNRSGGRCGTATHPPAAPPALPTAPNNAFYFAPIGGWGVAGGGNACTGQVLVDASGNELTVGRSSAATCIRESDGLGVELAADEPAVIQMPDASTHYGFVREQQSTNQLIWSYRLDRDTTDAGAGAWTIAGGTLTADEWAGPFSHYRAASGYEKLFDEDDAGTASVCQTYTSSTQTSYALTCSLRAGTLTKARLKITGTGNSAGDRTCSFTDLISGIRRENRRGCVTGAAYGAGITAVTACVLAGSADTDMGTIGATDCQLEKLGHVTSYIPTTTTAVTRLVSTLSYPRVPATLTLSNIAGCLGAESFTARYDAESHWSVIPAGKDLARSAYFFPDTSVKAYDGTTVVTATGVTSVWNRVVDGVTSWSDAGLTVTTGAVSGSGAYDGTMFGTGSITAGTLFVGPNDSSADVAVGNVRYGLDGGECASQATMTRVARAGWIGDSISASHPIGGEKTPDGVFRRASFNGTNFSHGGDVWSQCAAQWATSGNGTYDRVFVWCGVNDILAGTDGHTLFTTMRTWVDEWLYRGIKVYWLDITPFKGYDSTAGKLTARTNFNSDQATYCGTAPTGLQCFAVSSLVWNPADHDSLLAANTSDGLHPTQAMSDIVAAYVAANYVP